ncbi:hypothetical protein C2G38_2318854 [Gigaspora rosea]|uniref:Uncharacterized protein n=1 Tax=Gigaspora rosea TaxID=44941 RepID=A0A397V0Y2_9GLOM|nr:hypothetical protein C2G38_2318854 [Gigaspora rosea]
MQVVKELDIKLFAQADYTTLKKNELDMLLLMVRIRSFFLIDVVYDPAVFNNLFLLSGYWTDPPNYFDTMVSPNYIKCHRHLFQAHLVNIDKLVVLNSNCVRDIYTNLKLDVLF